MSSNPIERRLRGWVEPRPEHRQLTGPDRLGRGAAAQSPRSKALRPRTDTPSAPARSVCPHCAARSPQLGYPHAPVGGARLVCADAGRVVQIEGDPDSPVSRGRLCPKGSASLQLVTGPQREEKVRYRAPYATEWTDPPLDTAMDMIADRVLDARRRGWQDTDDQGNVLRRTMGLAGLGGATTDNEENYLFKKLWTALGAVQIENQARI